LISEPKNLEELVTEVEHAAVETLAAPRGATVVITSKTPFLEAQLTNVLTLHTIVGRSTASAITPP
jgi:hypothetical protein